MSGQGVSSCCFMHPLYSSYLIAKCTGATSHCGQLSVHIKAAHRGSPAPLPQAAEEVCGSGRVEGVKGEAGGGAIESKAGSMSGREQLQSCQLRKTTLHPTLL